MKVEGAILAGGKNSRYHGQNKAFILISNERIIDLNLRVLNPFFSKISIITNNSDQFREYKNYSMNSDYFHDIGPLAGIHSALKNCDIDGVFISSCDMPFLDETILDVILKTAKARDVDAVIPRINDKIEPLFAFYSSSILDKLEAHIKESKSRSIRSFLAIIKTEYVDFEDNEKTRKAFTNINRPEDLALLNL